MPGGEGADRKTLAMSRISPPDASHEIALDSLQATADLAAALARVARPGDVFALKGELGVGKTAFARAFIRAFARLKGAPAPDEVPSPTFTLMQSYDAHGTSVHHVDLFRIAGPGEVEELGLDEAMAAGVTLIEWPERLGMRLPACRLELLFRYGWGAERRTVQLSGAGDWAGRLREAGLA